MLSTSTIQVGAVPASGNGHSTGKTPGVCAPADGSGRAIDHILAAAAAATKLEP